MSPAANASAAVPVAARATMSIGEVLGALRSDFPDVTISKIRFLETEGLVGPQRTPSGYRKFSHEDLARLRYVLRAQRDQYLPLRVIKQHLEAMDRGLEPPAAGAGPRVPRAVLDPDVTPGPEHFARRSPRLRLSRSELAAASDLDPDAVAALETFGLISAEPGGLFHEDALAIARLAGRMARFGLEPRHLRPFRVAAEREVGLVEQVVAPMLRRPGSESRARAEEAVRELAALSVGLHAALVRSGLRPRRDG